jgi:uncharacterized protein (UPF0335 family)
MILLFSAPLTNIAQEYGDLLSLLVSEEYEKVIKKASKYIDSDKTKKDPLPYLYFSEAMYRMSLDNKYKMDYPKAFKTALSYAAKFRKKDKTNAYAEEAVDYIEELKLVIAEEVENYMDENSPKGFKKALNLMKKVVQFSPEDKGAAVTRAILEVYTGNKSEGRKMIAAAWKEVQVIGKDGNQFEDLTEQTQYNLRFALMRYALYMKKTDLGKAQAIIGFGHQYFYIENEDYQKEYTEDYKLLYDEIN